MASDRPGGVIGAGDGLQDIVLVDYGSFVYWPNKGYGDWGVGGVCPAGQLTQLEQETVLAEPTCDGAFRETDGGDEGCGCDTGTPGASLPFALLALALLGLIRRRRRGSRQ